MLRWPLSWRTLMPLHIVSVAMLDVKVTGRDQFFVQINDSQVMLYEASTAGKVDAVVKEPAPLRYVTASIEKFNNHYRCEKPVPIRDVKDLPGYLGKFVITSDTACRYVP